jgi:hypothetical protein
MRQEVEIVLTLEVDVNKSKQDIINEFNILFNGHYCFSFIKIKSIKEESELYQTE